MSKETFRWAVFPLLIFLWVLMAWMIAIGGADPTTQYVCWVAITILYGGYGIFLWRL